jgi:hypothetical protein
MSMPPLRHFADEVQCGLHYRNVYCAGPIPTFDGIMVRFDKRDFLHLFFDSSKRDGNKDKFSTRRAERIDWIKAALQDPNAELYQGYNNETKKPMPDRRVCLVSGDYVVIIDVLDKNRAKIITAYVVDKPEVLVLIKSNPKWR